MIQECKIYFSLGSVCYTHYYKHFLYFLEIRVSEKMCGNKCNIV